MSKRADQEFLRYAGDQNWANALLAIDRGANVDAQNTQGNTALHLASAYNRLSSGRCAFLKALLDRGARSEIFNHNGKTPAQIALITNDWGAWEFWVTHDPKVVNAPTQEGFSPLFEGRSHMKVHPITEETFLTWMLRHNVDLQWVEPSGFGVLYGACGDPVANLPPNATMMNDLLDRGAPVITLSIWDKKSPLGLIAWSGDQTLTERLLTIGERQAQADSAQKMPTWHQILLHSVLVTHNNNNKNNAEKKKMSSSLESTTGAQVLDHIDRHHPGLLNHPVISGGRSAITDEGCTVLHLLTMQGASVTNLQHLQTLVARGADIMARDAQGQTPAQRAQNPRDAEWLELMETLQNVPTSPRSRSRL